MYVMFLTCSGDFITVLPLREEILGKNIESLAEMSLNAMGEFINRIQLKKYFMSWEDMFLIMVWDSHANLGCSISHWVYTPYNYLMVLTREYYWCYLLW